VVASTSLLGSVGEPLDAGHDRIIRLGDIDMVVDDVAGMRDPSLAEHHLVVDGVAERVGHATVKDGKPDAAASGLGTVEHLALLDLAHHRLSV
jgi:hypothetical protein